MTILLITEAAQVVLSLLGTVLSAHQLFQAFLNHRATGNGGGSLGLIARIRQRRERARLYKHLTFLIGGIVVLVWRFEHQDMIRAVAGPTRYYSATGTRDLQVLIVTFILFRESVYDLYDRIRVEQAIEKETAVTPPAKEIR